MSEIIRQRFRSYADNLKSKTCPELDRRIENLKWLGCFTITVALVLGGAVALAQQSTKISRIGFLITSSPSAIAPRMDAFVQGLRELGYVEGKNIVIERRHADGKFDRLSDLAAELVRLNVDVIVSSGPTATRPAKSATSTIPIVMTFDDDPVGSGFVASLARPGGNVTGLSTLSPEISGKQLELLKEIVPKLGRVAVIGTSTRQGTEQSLKELEPAAGALGVKLQYLDIPNSKDIESAFRAASKGGPTRFWCCRVPFSIPTEHRLQTSRSRAGSRRHTPGENLSKTAG
jgi:putative ABC transport system substrate-binding protein